MWLLLKQKGNYGETKIRIIVKGYARNEQVRAENSGENRQSASSNTGKKKQTKYNQRH